LIDEFLDFIQSVAKEKHKNYIFSQREIRLALCQCKTTCKNHFRELVQLEYIEKTGGYSNRGYKYRIIYWDDLIKLRNKLKRSLNKQITSLYNLVAAGEHLQNGHQDSRGTKEKALVAANFKNTYKRGGKK